MPTLLSSSYTCDDYLRPHEREEKAKAVSLIPIPKFNIGDIVKTCDHSADNGSGYRYKSGQYDHVRGLCNHTITILSSKYIEEKNEWYYSKYSPFESSFAEHALTLISPNVFSSSTEEHYDIY